MKKNTMMMLALAAMTAGVSVHAEPTQSAAAPAQTAQVAATTADAAATKLSADELAFAAKMNDQNRKSFSEKLSAEQRKSAMVAAKNGANADEAVQRLVASKEIKEAPVVANAEKATAEKTAPAAAVTK